MRPELVTLAFHTLPTILNTRMPKENVCVQERVLSVQNLLHKRRPDLERFSLECSSSIDNQESSLTHSSKYKHGNQYGNINKFV